MPTPVSTTEKPITRSAFESTSPANCRPSAWPTRRTTPPSSVNLNAFESRFFSTCCSRCSSVTIVGSAFSAKSSSKESPFSAATGRNERSSAVSSAATETSPMFTSIFPASTLERSRMSLISPSSSDPALWIVVANSVCFSVRLPSGLSASSFARIRSELSGVRSSCDMFARNSDLYLEESASCSAFSSSALRASSISAFLISIRRFCSSSCCERSSSSSFVCCSSSCWVWSSSSDARRVAVCASSSAFDRFSSSCCACSSSDWLCRSCVSCCDWSRSSSVRMFARIVFRTTPIDSESWSRNVCWTSVNGVNDASSSTAITFSSKRMGRTMMLVGAASPSPEAILM